MEPLRVGGEADELALRVVGGDAELVHELRGVGALRREPLQHRLQRRTGVGTVERVLCEQGEHTGGVFEAEAGLVGDETGLRDRVGHAGDVGR